MVGWLLNWLVGWLVACLDDWMVAWLHKQHLFYSPCTYIHCIDREKITILFVLRKA